MFKCIISLSFCLLFSSGLFAQENDYSRWNLNDRVKVISEQVFDVQVVDTSIVSLAYSYHNTFDQFGNKVLDIRMKPDGRVDENYVYAYDEHHQRDKSYQYGFDGELIRTIYYLYDSRGALKADSSIMADGKIDKVFKYFYDGDGFLVYDESYDGHGNLKIKYEYGYDSRGRKTEINRINRNGEPEKRSVLTYDENNQVVVERTYLPDGSLKNETVYRYLYDENNNWVEKTIVWDGRTAKKITRDITYY